MTRDMRHQSSRASRAARGERLYRWATRLYPKDFRARYGQDLLAFYRERVSEDGHSPLQLGLIWARLIPDLVASALGERLASAAARRVRSRVGSSSLHRPEETMSVLEQDVRFAFRGMIHRPGFTAVVLATLALGIGANTAIFSVVDPVLLRPLPFAHVERIVRLKHEDPYSTVSEPEFVDYQRGMNSIANLAAYNSGESTLASADAPIIAMGTRVSHDFFNVLGVKAAVGRLFASDEFSHLAKGRIAIISSGLWRQQFASDPAIVGKTIDINGNPVTIIGVMPANFSFPSAATGFWVPWRLNPDSLWTRNNHYLQLIGRLAPNATLEQASAQMRTLEQRWMRDFPETYDPKKPLIGSAVRLSDDLLGATRPYLLALLGAVGLILLIACVNVANLLLVRSEGRRKEFAIRAALGASANRMLRQMLTESMLYALFGAALGMLVARVGLRALIAFAPRDLPRIGEIGVDYRVIAFTAAITLVTGVLFGLVPAIRGMRGETTDGLREGGRTSGSGRSRAARRTLVITEVALAVIMSTGAGLLIRSLAKLRAIDLGFDPQHVLTMQLTLPPKRYSDTTADEFFRQTLNGVAHLPGVRSASLDGALPISGDESGWSIMLDGRVVKTIAEAPWAKPDQVTPDYFKTLGIRLVRGRAFSDADRMGAPPVAVINESMAKKLWPGADPIGHTLKMFGDKSPWVNIVGVVGDVRARGFQDEIPPTMYFPYSQSGSSAYYMPRSMTLVVRTIGNPSDAVPAVRTVVRALDAHVPISQVATMEDVVAGSIASRRFTTLLLGGFAALALTLAGIGIYGVIAFGVSQRTFEIGVRIALGASTGSVIRLVMREGVRMTIAGLAIGLAGAVVVDRFLNSLLVGVSGNDPATLGGVVALLIGVAACACALPARRATAVSPTEALRDG